MFRFTLLMSVLFVLSACVSAPTYKSARNISEPMFLSGTWQEGSNVTEPRPVESKYLLEEHGGTVVIESGAGLYLKAKVKEAPERELHMVIEYDNPSSPSSPLVNEQVFPVNAEGFVFSSPSVTQGLAGYHDYKVSVYIYKSRAKVALVDKLVQVVRSYVDTTTNKVFIKEGLMAR
ncbi:MAG: hypothetical protein ABW082_07885 [Sedimenticola sp.]